MANETLSVEKHSIDFVPLAERYGKARGLFGMWFSTNCNVSLMATGAIAVALGLPLLWAIAGSVIGHLIGGVFMAAHSAQGPRLGIPQMIQSRAQFGYVGATVPLLLVILMYLGYFAVGGIITGYALAGWLGWNVDVCIVAWCMLSALFAVFGYRLLRATIGIFAWINLVTCAILTIGFLTRNDVGAAAEAGNFTWPVFLLAVTLAATWQLTYAPYVADYSRYLPADTSVRASFWWTYLGTSLASIWMFSIGAAATAVSIDAFAHGSIDFILNQAGFAPRLFLAITLITSFPVLGLQVYGTFMSATTIAGSVWHFRKISQGIRVVSILTIAGIGSAIAVAARGDFLGNLTTFIVLLALFLVPWTSINLVDFYLVRRERYDIDAIFEPEGRYRGTDWRAMTAYLLGIAFSIPFISSSFFTGFLVDDLGGADISWAPGLILSSVTYYLLMTRFPERRGYMPTPEEDQMEVADVAVVAVPQGA